MVPYSPPWWLGYTLAAKDTGWRFVGTGHDLGPIDEQEARSKDPKPTGVQRTGGGLLTMDATVKQRLIERLTQADTAAQKRRRTKGRLTQRNGGRVLRDHVCVRPIQ